MIVDVKPHILSPAISVVFFFFLRKPNGRTFFWPASPQQKFILILVLAHEDCKAWIGNGREEKHLDNKKHSFEKRKAKSQKPT
jgi:hypothetical protein